MCVCGGVVEVSLAVAGISFLVRVWKKHRAACHAKKEAKCGCCPPPCSCLDLNGGQECCCEASSPKEGKCNHG